MLTCNDTSDYCWPDFERRASDVVAKLYDAHPRVADLKIQSILLRYVDAVDFDYSRESAFDFWRDYLKVDLRFPENLFLETGVNRLPQRSAWQTTFRCENPRGQVQVSFATGQKHGQPAIIWETMVQSAGTDLPNMPEGFSAWLNSAAQDYK